MSHNQEKDNISIHSIESESVSSNCESSSSRSRKSNLEDSDDEETIQLPENGPNNIQELRIKSDTSVVGKVIINNHNNYILPPENLPKQNNEVSSDDKNPKNAADPKITVSIPEENLVRTFDFIYSRRFKWIIVIVLVGTTLFTASIIVLRVLLDNHFMNSITTPDPCQWIPCTTQSNF
uniref:CSON003217 protein n=1 Tax=Culicoides sonorensis TaxID=179676 RepID=A0A336LST8_CULSO